MFDFLKRPRITSLTDTLTEHVLRGQPTLYGFFRETLGCKEKDIRKMELTYFAVSVMTFAFVRFASGSKSEQILNYFTQSVLKKSLASSLEQTPFQRIVREYQDRLAEYEALLPKLFNDGAMGEIDPAITVWHHVFGSVTNASVALTTTMQDIAGTRLVLEFGADNIKFVKNVIAAESAQLS